MYLRKYGGKYGSMDWSFSIESVTSEEWFGDCGYFYTTVHRHDNSSCEHTQCNIEDVFSNISVSHNSRSVIFIKTHQTLPKVLSNTDLSSCTDNPPCYINAALEVYTHPTKSPLSDTVSLAAVLFSKRGGHLKSLMPRKPNSAAGPLGVRS